MSIQIVREPRWPAFVAMLAAAGVYLALPAPLSLGPSWLLLLVIVLLLIPIVISDRRGHHNVARILTLAANIIITIAMIASLIHLVTGIPQHLEVRRPRFGSPIFSYSHSGTGSSTLAVPAARASAWPHE